MAKATKKELRQLAAVKESLIKAIGRHNVSSKVVFAALVDVTVDAGIIVAGKALAAEAICRAVNVRLLTTPAKKVDP